jgi:hypothetical protein
VAGNGRVEAERGLKFLAVTYALCERLCFMRFRVLQARGSRRISRRSPEIPKPRRRQLGVAHRVLDIPVTEISPQGSGVVPLVGKRVTAGVAQHVGMGLEAKTRLNPSPLDHAGEPIGAEGRPALRCEYEGRLRPLLATLGYPARPSQRSPHPR